MANRDDDAGLTSATSLREGWSGEACGRLENALCPAPGARTKHGTVDIMIYSGLTNSLFTPPLSLSSQPLPPSLNPTPSFKQSWATRPQQHYRAGTTARTLLCPTRLCTRSFSIATLPCQQSGLSN